MSKKKRVIHKKSVPKKIQSKKKSPPLKVEVIKPSFRKRKLKSASKMYWTEETEEYVVKYQNEENDEIREQIYREKLETPIRKLIECIFNRFRFTYFRTSPQDVQQEALEHVVSNIWKFDRWKPGKDGKIPKKPRKAYSYFSVVTKNWFILLNNTTYKEFQTQVPISEERGEDTIQLQTVDKHHAQAETNEFMKLTIDFWEANVSKIFGKQRDLEIAYAVMELLRSAQRIDAFNKKALYLYIRDMSDCKTQQITKVINKMKQYHKSIHKMYLNDGVISTSLHLA